MEKKKKHPGLALKIVTTALRGLVCLVLVVLMLAVNTILPTYARMANSILNGFDISVDNSDVDTTGLDLDYYTCDYTADTISNAEDALADQIADEGVVLLENDGTLPLSADTVYSLFSVNSTAASSDGYSGGRDLQTLFAEAGVSINTTLWDFYSAKAGEGYGLGSGSISYGVAEDFSINEVPLSELEAEDGLLESVEGTVPVYWLKRVVGEGRDMPRSMYNHTDVEEDKSKSYLELNSVELELIQYLNDNFDQVILVVNSTAAMELGWLEDYPNITAVLYAPGGIESVPRILSGETNPSGRTVDTFAADALASPAAQNFGDYQYTDEDGNLTVYNYVSYEEGIYVGYKYYETRYEDVILNQGNAGDYDYDTAVIYPFGYGLSYTTFEWSNMTTAWTEDTCTVTVDVTNTGDVAGKDVVEVYIQSPYTEYDIANSVEKASVALVGYGKTSELEPGATETVEVSFSREQLKSYDYTNAQTYILDAGDYYVTAAVNAHAAVNNVLAAKGADVEGDASFTSLYVVDEFDAATYSVDSYSGVAITNQLSDAQGDVTYLTRSDWVGTFPTHDGEVSTQVSTWGNEVNGEDGVSYTYTKVASDELLAQLASFDSGSPVDASTIDVDIVYGADNGLTLIDLRGLDYDDPLWDDLLDQLTAEDYYTTVSCSGYGVEVIESVDKPFTIDSDTANGLLYGGTGRYYPNSMTLAQTWNQELALEFGTMIGNEALLGGCNGWYAPSMNIHRTPFSGRNGEYYSEDAFLSGAVASNAIYGAATKGVYAYIKHFAFNDQEDHRGDTEGQYSVATWLNEQAAREIYLVPFEMCMKVGDVELKYIAQDEDGNLTNATTTIRAAQAVMSSFNRVGATWTGGCYNLLTGILRTEWAFDGFVITDAANTGVFMDGYQMTEAGGDAKLTYLEEAARYDFDENDEATYYYARQAMHHILYTIANSNAMNDLAPGGTFVEGMRIVDKVIIGVNTICVLLILWIAYTIFRTFKPSKRKLAKLERKAAKKAARKAAKQA
ncbi:MAG: glycoside hydrolase family 3 C-terminal domain-containing protein [Firmicutes bacterium]|nr:glycoside hydrolase family 3 C-terminal domain-containing protein [Bacillota bacterium]